VGKGELLAVTSYDPAPPPVSYIKVSGGLERYMRAYSIEWTAFVDAVVEGKPVLAGIQGGVNALALAEASNLSLAKGRSVALAEVLPEA